MEEDKVWKIIDKYFEDNPQALVNHHVDSFNNFYKEGIFQIFKEKNPVSIYSRLDPKTNEYLSECHLYMGGKKGDKIYFGKPVIHDENNSHYMYPNEARLRNMSYSMTVHYDVEIEFIDKIKPGQAPAMLGGEVGCSIDNNNNKSETPEIKGGAPKPVTIKKKKKEKENIELNPQQAAELRKELENSVDGTLQKRFHQIEKIFLGRFPIMVQSNFCILKGLPKEIRYSMGECKNDIGGYFIIDGKEKTVVSQEKFANNMLYIRKIEDENYLYSADIKSVSENISKPMRNMSVKICSPNKKFTNKNIVVNIPNVRAPVPLFIVFRALGIISDKSIISYCLLDLEKYETMVDLFIPSVHDASTVMNQQNALQFIALLTKGKGIRHAIEILNDYFLPHVGENNYIEKAYFLGNMVFQLLEVYTGLREPTDRDSFKFKRVELIGSLLYDLYREYWSMQLKTIQLNFEKKLFFNKSLYENNLFELIVENYPFAFQERVLENGFKKAFKGNWGAYAHSKRIGIIQDLNRLSFNSYINHLRKTNLPLDSSLKLVGPRVLHNSQWGFLDPIDTPDGGNIGLHKHLSISTYITRGASREPLIKWLKEKWGMKSVQEFQPKEVSFLTKVFVNGYWSGLVDNPRECVRIFNLYRRNALIPIYASASFDISQNTIFVFNDDGRVCRPIFYRDDETKKPSYHSKEIMKRIENDDFTWTDLICGFNKRRSSLMFDPSNMEIFELYQLYEGIESETNPAKLERFLSEKAIIDYIDNNVSENALIALDPETFEKGSINSQENMDIQPNKHMKQFTNCEIHNSFIFGIMSNLIVYPENNPATRNSFSCGQSKQAVSLYHTNYQARMDKTSVVLDNGQIPLVKTRYLRPINNEENCYGENVLVAIACYTGYNVEDAVLVNEASLKRGLFRTSYFNSYEAHEETTKNAHTVTDIRFMNIESEPSVLGLKEGYDYSKLDKFGVIKEGSIVSDKTVLIGMVTINSPPPGSSPDIETSYRDASIFPKKGQLGIVDKVFMTDDEEGKRIAKVRILESRIPKIGDKMASRAGQKGTVGNIVPEVDLPFTKDGIRPDLIINPHAIPSRMTIGQLVETLTGKACTEAGTFGDCTAFNNKGSKVSVFGNLLTKYGFHNSGNEIMYDGMNGKQMDSVIFMGPTYYMRLKHMVKDKINARAKGPVTSLTRQTVGGRAQDGGLRIGEMERDTVISHGISNFLQESMMERGDKYYMAICNHSGVISIYNPGKNLFMSPIVDGPIKYVGSLENVDDLRLEYKTEFGRSFSIVSVPYSFKLLIQELQTINIQLRIITEDNINQISNMSTNINIEKLTHKKTGVKTIVEMIKEKLNRPNDKLFTPDSESLEEIKQSEESEPSVLDDESSGYHPISPDEEEKRSYEPFTPSGSPQNFQPRSPSYSPPGAKGKLSEDNLNIIIPDEQNGEPSISQQEDMSNLFGDSDDSYIPPPPADEKKVGGRVYLKEDINHPTRNWTIAHIGNKFMTIKTDDSHGLNEDDMVKVVSPEELCSQQFAESMLRHLEEKESLVNTAPAQPPNTPTVIIAPKFFNGNGSDNSVGQEESMIPQENHNIIQPIQPVVQVIPEEKNNKEIDFSKEIKITKI